MKTLFYIFFMLMLLLSCSKKQEIKYEPTTTNSDVVTLTDEQIAQGEIQLGKPESKNLTQTIRVTGSIEAPPGNVISVSFPFGGYVRRMNLLPGTKVSKGEVLATLEDPQYIQLQQDYLTAKSRLAYLQTEFSRQKELNSDKTSSDKTFQQVKDEYESQLISVKALSEKLKLIKLNPDELTPERISGSVNIYSPINGFVTEIFVNTGKYVSATDVLFELVNPADVHLILNVYEKDIHKLSVGQHVTCYRGNEQQKFPAQVHLISKSVRADRTSEVHCDFTGDVSAFLPGMFVTADVELTNQDVQAVPDDAVVSQAGKNYVFVSQGNNVFGLTEVETGLTTAGFTEIKTDLKSQAIVVKNAYTLFMKLRNTEED